MGYIFTFLKSQIFGKLSYPDSDFSGQTIIITGSNTGLGLEAARHLVRLNTGRVILAVRTVAKGKAAAEAIKESQPKSSTMIDVWRLDLSDYKSVRAFGSRVNSLDRLDALVQNAGILTNQFNIVEGTESTIAINVIGAILVGLLALPKLRQSASKNQSQGRLSFVGSDLQCIAKFKEKETPGSLFGALQQQEGIDMDDRYRTSKLLLLYAVRAIAAECPITSHSNVVINYLTPGACKSDMLRNNAGPMARCFQKIAVSMIARTTEYSSRALVHAIKPDVGEDTHGRYLMDSRIFSEGENVNGDIGRGQQERLKEELWPILEKISPGVTKNLSGQPRRRSARMLGVLHIV